MMPYVCSGAGLLENNRFWVVAQKGNMLGKMGGIGTKHNYNMPPNIQKSDPETKNKIFFPKEENKICFETFWK